MIPNSSIAAFSADVSSGCFDYTDDTRERRGARRIAANIAKLLELLCKS